MSQLVTIAFDPGASDAAFDPGAVDPGAFPDAFSSGLGSFGSPSTRSATMLRWIWAVPPQIVSDLEKKKAV
jgi:hypothetical protein